jgi:hypothetical protein
VNPEILEAKGVNEELTGKASNAIAELVENQLVLVSGGFGEVIL